jgi:hypothetical protein
MWPELKVRYSADCVGEEFQSHVSMGLNVFPVSHSVFRRERIRGHPSEQETKVGSSSAQSSCVTITLVALVSGTSSIVAISFEFAGPFRGLGASLEQRFNLSPASAMSSNASKARSRFPLSR